MAREIGAGVSMIVNVRADALLGSGQAAGDARLLDTLRGIADHLRGGTPADLAALRGSDLQRTDANLDALNQKRAIIGAGTARLDSAKERLAEVEEATLSLLSETEDTDMARAMVDFSIQQSALQAGLKAGANIVQASLLDFLR